MIKTNDSSIFFFYYDIILSTTAPLYFWLFYNCFSLYLKQSQIAILRFIILALERAKTISKQADVIAALSLEVLKGTTKAFNKGRYIQKIC